MKAFWGAILIGLFAMTPIARACDEQIGFSDEQVIELLDKIKSLSQSDFKTMLEYDRLLCAKRKIVRDTARRVGRSSKIGVVRSSALQSALFEKDVINLTVLPKENMTDEERKFLSKTPLLSYEVRFVDRAKGCVSLSNWKKCDPNYLLSVSGSEVDIRYNNEIAKLRLTEEDRLRGIWNNGNGVGAVSVGVEIRLD